MDNNKFRAWSLALLAVPGVIVTILLPGFAQGPHVKKPFPIKHRTLHDVLTELSKEVDAHGSYTSVLTNGSRIKIACTVRQSGVKAITVSNQTSQASGRNAIVDHVPLSQLSPDPDIRLDHDTSYTLETRDGKHEVYDVVLTTLGSQKAIKIDFISSSPNGTQTGKSSDTTASFGISLDNRPSADRAAVLLTEAIKLAKK